MVIEQGLSPEVHNATVSDASDVPTIKTFKVAFWNEAFLKKLPSEVPDKMLLLCDQASRQQC